METVSFFQPGYVPPTAFYFAVKFPRSKPLDSSFQEVSGLKVTVETMEMKEGGDNLFVHHLPQSIKYENLVLKRCLLPGSDLEKWCRNAIENFKFEPKDIFLHLLAPKSNILASWSIVQAFPVSWELGSLSSTKNELAIETLTLKYRYFKKLR
ncbi:hypothetical protein P872_20220 [Rhodonellum psychrophilum GCM71 = DSM 17998]|uniref:Glycerol acyltransferase n=2 Tax=Rhodonellum TaxID=336827 RepID=U5BUK0_9BACT|nr:MULTISPECIES: phage tail protein [Rhodonellum]ERM81214.1 hypothetical protein P872_20220 [Rhodonellum psychrophilum GCM71 = DSM 17998]MDO9554660.1 phage tail protein [Rhodonellum sp.]SDZ52353.1 conserved hypothetical phage tail region protein [Rhodonellum ikkaensis]